MPVTPHGSENTWNPVTVKVVVCAAASGPHVGQSGRFCPQYPSAFDGVCRKTASCANGSADPLVTEMVTPNCPEPRLKNVPGGVPIGDSVVPDAGVGAEMTTLAGAEGAEGTESLLS